MHAMSPAFLKCWEAAGRHLDTQVPGGITTWLRGHPTPPILEHLSFRLSNQLFFIRVEDVDDTVDGPSSLHELYLIAESCQGHACVMPMKQTLFGDGWAAAAPGWGLVDAKSRKPINPIELVTDEKIEMTRWELQDFAVQVVRDQLLKDNYQLMSWQGNPDVDPALWFVGKSKKPEWVVVRTVRYPEKKAVLPVNWDAIVADCSHMGQIGHFASVAFACPDDLLDPSRANVVPLYRGHATDVEYEGLDPLFTFGRFLGTA